MENSRNIERITSVIAALSGDSAEIGDSEAALQELLLMAREEAQTQMDDAIEVVDEEPKTPIQHLVEHLRTNKRSIATRLHTEFHDGGDKGIEPIGNVARDIMNVDVFPFIAKSIKISDLASLQRFYTARLLPLFELLHKSFIKGIFQKKLYLEVGGGAWTYSGDSSLTDAQNFIRFIHFIKKDNGWRHKGTCVKHGGDLATSIFNLREFLTTVECKNRRLVDATFDDLGYVFYSELPGKRPTGNRLIQTIEDYEDIIDEMIASFVESRPEVVAQPEPEQVLPEIGDWEKVSSDMEIYMKRLAVSGELNQVLEEALFGSQAPVTAFQLNYFDQPRTRIGLTSWFYGPSQVKIESGLDEYPTSSDVIKGLYDLGALVLSLRDSGTILAENGVDPEQRHAGLVEWELARLLGKEFNRICVAFEADANVGTNLARALTVVRDFAVFETEHDQAEVTELLLRRDATKEVLALSEVDS